MKPDEEAKVANTPSAPEKKKPAYIPAGSSASAEQIPTDGYRTVAPQPPAFVSGERTAAVASGMADDVAHSWKQGRYARGIGQGIRGAAIMVPAAFADAGADIAYHGAPLGRGTKDFFKGLFDIEDAAPDTAQNTPVAPHTAPNTAPNTTTNTAKPATQPATPAAAAANTHAEPTGAQTAPPAAREVVPGVYEHGRGNYSDDPHGSGFGLQSTGQPNARHIAAADTLAQRSQHAAVARMMAADTNARQAQHAPQVAAPSVAHSGNDWQRKKDLQNAQTAASSVMWQTRFMGPRRAAAVMQNDPRMVHYRALLEQDHQARGLHAQNNMQAMAHNAQNQRHHASVGLDAQRLDLAQQQHNLEVAKAGPGIDNEKLLAQLREEIIKTSDTKQRATLHEIIDRLYGKGGASLKDRYITLGGQQSTDPATGQKITGPERVIDLAKQQEVYF